MKIPISRPVPKAPSLFDRMRGRKDKSEALAMLWDVIQLAPCPDLVRQIERVETATKVNVAGELMAEGAVWLAAVARQIFAEKVLTEQGKAELAAMQQIFRLPEAKKTEIVRLEASRVYRSELEAIVKAGKVSDADAERIDALGVALGLPEAEIDRIRSAVFGPYIQNKVNMAVADKRLSPDEDEEITHLSKRLHIQLTMNGETRTAMERFRQLWRVENTALASVRVDILLPQAEACYWYGEVAYAELGRTVELHTSGSIGGQSINGMHWESGTTTTVGESGPKILGRDKGELFLTNRRLIFNGALKNLSVKLDQVLKVQAFKDGLKVDIANSADSYFLFDKDPDVAGAILTRMVREYKGD